MAATKCLAAQCLGSLEVALEKYEKKVKVARGATDLPVILDEGFALIELVDQANILFGGILFVTYFISIVSTIAGLYFVVGSVISALTLKITNFGMALFVMAVCVISYAQVTTRLSFW